jgi:hypothetical protein
VGPADPAGDIDAEGDGQCPPPGDQQPVATGREDFGAAAGLVQGGHRHGDHAVAEGDQDQGAEELRQQLSPHRRPQTGGRSGHRESPLPAAGPPTVLLMQ